MNNDQLEIMSQVPRSPGMGVNVLKMKISLDANKGTWYYGRHEEIYGNNKRHPLWSEDSNVPAYKIG